MRRRLIRLVLMAVVVPLAAASAEQLADRLEAASGPSRATRALRHGSVLGRRVSGRGRR